MLPMECLDVLENFKFNGLFSAWNMCFTMRQVHDNQYEVKLLVRLPNIATGDFAVFGNEQILDVVALDKASLLDKLHEMAKYVVLHELDESIYVDGVVVYDPHK